MKKGGPVISRYRDDSAEGTVGAALTADWLTAARHWLAMWRDIRSGSTIGRDILAGLTVAAVALPLNLALAVSSGVRPEAGLVSGAVGGFLAGFFGGTSLQVAGPAAALSVMVMAIAQKFGAVGVAAAALLSGLVQLVLAFVRAGHLAKWVPEAVLAGFTTAVGIKLLDQQLPELLGFDYSVADLAAMMHRPEWLHKVEWFSAICGLFVAFVMVVGKPYKRFPAAIIGIAVISGVAAKVGWQVKLVGQVPSSFPHPAFPLLPDEQWLDLFIAVLPLAVLAATESLLSSSAVDRMAKDVRSHNPSLELFGQGIANIGVGLVAGMPVTGVIVRSGLNAQSGGRTRLAAIFHAVFLAAAVLYFSEYIARVPVAALAGLLCVIGVRLIEVGTLFELIRHDKLSAAAFLVTCAGTVTGHLATGLGVGMLVYYARRFTVNHEAAERQQLKRELAPGIRGVVHAQRGSAHGHGETPSAAGWIRHVRAQAFIPKTAYIHPQATVIGRVVLGENVHIAAGSSVRADEGTPFFIGANSNIQDGVVIHALQTKWVTVGDEDWAVYVGRNVSMAHDALVHGPCYVGDDTFIGFKAVVHDSIVGPACFIGIGAVVVGVDIPAGKFVPHGSIIDSQDQVDNLPAVDETQRHFNEDVVEVNRGLAAAYRAVHAGPNVVGGTASRAAAPATRYAFWDERLAVSRQRD